MKFTKLSMGCLSSRSTIAPSEDRVESKVEGKDENLKFMDDSNGNNTRGRNDDSSSKSTTSNRSKESIKVSRQRDKIKQKESNNPSSCDNGDDNNISVSKFENRMLQEDEDAMSARLEGGKNFEDDEFAEGNGLELDVEDQEDGLEGEDDDEEENGETDGDKRVVYRDIKGSIGGREADSSFKDSFDGEPDIELLRQYVAIDYEITQLEDKDTLRVYHEKIEQLELLEQELDMINTEVEEVAARSDTNENFQSEPKRIQSSAISNNMTNESNNYEPSGKGDSARKQPIDTTSIASCATGSASQKFQQSSRNGEQKIGTSDNNMDVNDRSLSVVGSSKNNNKKLSAISVSSKQQTAISYSSVEEVFNRRIILEKERDKLKKEVEIVIVECDRLQQRYKRRDEILDKLFDGRAGNGLENHLEQQLNWLFEQKHYVDQVFYAWKRAETLTSQTCEQFANALELLKRMSELGEEDREEKSELAKNISRLLIKSRQDMEQAQKYNPNVDAPFFTNNETEKFDKMIETISANSIEPNEYGQIITVIQFAYKRAISIRLWLEQILQTTIARDSFELTEEYKWIAIQLRKERINLIKSMLHKQPYRSMAQSVVQELVAARQQQAILSAADNGNKRRQQQANHDAVNRDSGVESELNDIDIEEEIYRLLEMNKARLEGNLVGAPSENKSQAVQKDEKASVHTAIGKSLSRDQVMLNRIQRRVKQSDSVNSSNEPVGRLPDSAGHMSQASTLNSVSTPSKLRIELDEEARQSLLRQVDKIHNKHKNRIERLKGSNRAKANSLMLNKMQQASKQNPN